jgi:membrane-bound lytic murein transglycosylase D
MQPSSRSKIQVRAFIFLCISCFMLLSCTTINTADSAAVKKDISPVQAALLPEPLKAPNALDNKTELSPEKKTVRVYPLLKEKISIANEESPAENDKSNKTKQFLNADKSVAETELFAEDNEMEEPSFSGTDKALLIKSNSKEDEQERDAMEEALVLLDEAHNLWTEGELDNALQVLDQAYVLSLDTNGNPEIARQKDDLRLIIAKKILAIYNSIQSPAKGMRGEIPLISNADVEKEIRSFQTSERDFFISSYQRSKIYRPVISDELRKAGLPEELSWLPLVESGFKINALSPARALGLWQFIPSTGYKYGLNRDYWIDERLDFEKSTRAAIAYLRELHSMFGDWLTALAGYNCGEGRVMRTIASQHINYLDNFWDLYQRLPNETARYVPRFLATLLITKNPQKYGFDLASEQNKYVLSDYETVETDRSIHLHDVAVKLETSENYFYLLNAELRYKITPDKTYKLKVPQGIAEKFLQIVAEIPDAKVPRASYKTVRSTFIKHRVRRGETLGSIAKKYHTSVNIIGSANKLSKKRVLYVKQILKIPLKKKVYVVAKRKTPIKKVSFYKAKKGDTLSAISYKHGISVSDLKKMNSLKNDAIQIGQTLRIRTGVSKDKTAIVKYRVKKGDSLSGIARKKGIPLRELLTLNKMSINDNIYPGQEIIVN